MGGKLLINGLLATMTGEHGGYGLPPHGAYGALAIKGKVIDWVGPAAALPDRYANWPRQDLAGRLVTPALIDCHTHLVFGGDRAGEFEMRLNGAGYRQIAEAGGGILSTVRQTRRLSEEELVQAALPRLDALLAEGVGTVEIKSGYGLTIDDELKMLRAARQLGDRRRVRIKTTFLAAHAVPRAYAGRAEAYIDEVCLPALDLAHEEGLVDAVDAFCEGIGFSVAQVEKVFRRAKRHGIALKLHAEQLSNLGGAAMAARHKALSADHLEFLDDAGVAEMARAGTIAVLLPGAYYTLGGGHRPPVEALRRAGVAMAVASDCNPGSSPLTSLLLAANMACTLFRLTPEEALAGITREAAGALGLANETGVLAAGKRADLAVWQVRQPAELAYRIGFNPLYKRYFGGQE